MDQKTLESVEIDSLGKRIRELRQRRGWSQQRLAERVGVQQKQISSYERDINIPSGEIFIRLASAFGVSLDYLAQRTPTSDAQAAIADLDLLEKAQYVDRLTEEDRTIVKQVMDLVILKDRYRKLAQSSEAISPAQLTEVARSA